MIALKSHVLYILASVCQIVVQYDICVGILFLYIYTKHGWITIAIYGFRDG